ncbi:MAG: RNA polymerase sigma factor [Bacteroidetes bacterium]|nr:RNA polymerase sigma factor [Bacteroidota bacterium]
MTQIEFKKLVEREARGLRYYAYQLTRNVEDTNDLMQETMLKAYTYQEKFEDGTNLKGINNYRRTQKRNTFVDQTDNDYYLDSVSPLVKNQGEMKFIMKDLEEALDSLPLSLKKPFTMNFKGFKYHEISELLNIPIGTVKTRIFVARRQLRMQLSDYAKDYGLNKVTINQ